VKWLWKPLSLASLLLQWWCSEEDLFLMMDFILQIPKYYCLRGLKWIAPGKLIHECYRGLWNLRKKTLKITCEWSINARGTVSQFWEGVQIVNPMISLLKIDSGISEGWHKIMDFFSLNSVFFVHVETLCLDVGESRLGCALWYCSNPRPTIYNPCNYGKLPDHYL